VAAIDTDFWLAVSTLGPVMFLAIGALVVELARSGLGWKTTTQRVTLVALNLAFFGTMLPTVNAILSLAWESNLWPPKVNAVVIVAAIVGFWTALMVHLSENEKTPGEDG
jgi:hypothetical protein